MRIIQAHRGFALLGVAVALAILATMAAGMSALIAGNHRGRTTMKYTQQAYYVCDAAFQYALNRIRLNGDASVVDRQFLSTSFGMTFTGGKITSLANYPASGDAGCNFSITNPGSGGVACMYVLAASGSGTLSVSGSNSLGSSSCGIWVNSSNSTAVTTVGSSNINAYFLKVVGGYSSGGSSSITTHSGSVQTGVSAVADPLLAYNMPTYGACDYNNMSISGSSDTTLNPGVYCGGLSIAGSGTVTFNPGNYIIDGGSFSSSGSANIVANDVTVFLNKQLGSSWPTLSLAGSGNRTIVAPTSGTYAGIAIFQSRSAPSATNSMSGSGTLNVTGAIYLPNQTLNFAGSSSSNAPCTLLVVDKLNISGTPSVACTSGALAGLIH